MKLMSENELKENFEKLKNGDLEARNKIVNSNIGLVRYIAKQYGAEGCDFEDLVSIGTIGLIKAVDTYDVTKNIKFSSYSGRCINNEILMNIRKNKLKMGNFKIVNINEPITCDYEGHELKYIDVIEDKNSDFITKMVDNFLSKELLNIINSLSEREKYIIVLYFGFNGCRYKQEEIADILGISQSYISRLILKILKKIKTKIMVEGSLEDFEKKLTRN